MKIILLLTTLIIMSDSKVYADDTAITVYSTATPGSINPNQFTGNRPNIPGYAMIKQDRIVDLQKGVS
ncbi:MAG: hypothetical protein KDI59_03195, partial [Xanthomonadales bacterium]|nr:hypothetical protein [Xanthomonadales bacterium]